MRVLDRLASALGRNDERPNVELAEGLVAHPEPAAISELAATLSGPTAIANDAIKVLYEVGARRPELVVDRLPDFVTLLGSRHNRNVWGALQAIATVTATAPEAVYSALPTILEAADRSSVIAKDKTVEILGTLVAAGYSGAVPELLKRVSEAAYNQFPSYAEVAERVATKADRQRLLAIVEARIGEFTQASKRARLARVIRKLSRQ